MKFDGIDIIEEGKEVFLYDNKKDNSTIDETNVPYAEKYNINLETENVFTLLLLTRDLNKNFEQKELHDKNIIQVNIEKATLNFALKFKNFLAKPIESKIQNIIVDLSYVKRMDSTFIGVLVDALRKAREYNGNIVLVANTNLMLSSFILLNLDILFTTFGTLEETMEYFNTWTEVCS